MENRREHWEQVYESKRSEDQSWFQPRPQISLALIQLAGCDTSASILDVGGGTSHLVDELLARDYRNISVIDIAP